MVDRAERRLSAILDSPTLSGRDQVDAVADLFDRLPQATQLELAYRDPERLANLNGVPFELRARCQRPRIAAARDRAAAAARDSVDAVSRLPPVTRNTETGSSLIEQQYARRLRIAPEHVRGHLWHLHEEYAALATAYRDLLEDRVPVVDPATGNAVFVPRSIVAFHPDRRSGIVEMRGRISPRTRDVALIITGSTNHNANFGRLSGFADDLVARNGPRGDLVAFMYMTNVPGTTLPDMLDTSYGMATAPEAAEFSYALQRELRRQATPGEASPVQVTAMLYSYGAFIGGLARGHGMYVDRYVYVAGVGAGVTSVEDYRTPPGFEDPEEYSMILRSDPVNKLRYPPLNRIGIALGNRFGLDPTTLPGVRRIDPGGYNGLCLSRELIGKSLEKSPDPHIAYLGRDTEAYDRLYAAMTGAEFEQQPDGFWVPVPREAPGTDRSVGTTPLLDRVAAASRLLPASVDRSRADPGAAATAPENRRSLQRRVRQAREQWKGLK